MFYWRTEKIKLTDKMSNKEAWVRKDNFLTANRRRKANRMNTSLEKLFIARRHLGKTEGYPRSWKTKNPVERWFKAGKKYWPLCEEVEDSRRWRGGIESRWTQIKSNDIKREYLINNKCNVRIIWKKYTIFYSLNVKILIMVFIVSWIKFVYVCEQY